VTVVDVEHTLMLRLSTECYVNRAHPQWINVAIRKIESGKWHALRVQWYGCNWLSWSISRALVWDSPSSHAARASPRLSFYSCSYGLWHLHWLVSVQSVDDLHSHVP
jgi:hypothetical protein